MITRDLSCSRNRIGTEQTGAGSVMRMSENSLARKFPLIAFYCALLRVINNNMHTMHALSAIMPYLFRHFILTSREISCHITQSEHPGNKG